MLNIITESKIEQVADILSQLWIKAEINNLGVVL